MVRQKSTPRSRSVSEDSSNKLAMGSKPANKMSHALQVIKYLRRTVHLLVPKACFYRLVRQIMRELGFPRMEIARIQERALEALQEAAEAYLVQFFEDCMLVTVHTGRTTLMLKDFYLVRRLRGRLDVINK